MSRLPTHGSPSRRSNFPGSDIQSGNVENDINQTSTGENISENWQRGEGYTMFTPKEEKRKKLLEAARKEEEQYQKRQEAKRSHPIKEPPRYLGGHASHADAVLKKQREVKVSSHSNSLQIRQKREKYIREKKNEEDKKNEERKAKARAQAVRNERRATEKQLALQEDRRRKNLEFLDRLEYSSSASAALASARHEVVEPRRLRNRSGPSKHQVHSPESPPNQGDLNYLSSLFPEYDEKTLATILKDVGGSVERAKALLS